jgi:hypothetical protein
MNRYDPVYSYRQDAPRPLSSPKEERAGVRRPRHSSLVTRHAFRFMEASAIPKSHTATMHPGLVGRVAPRAPRLRTRVSFKRRTFPANRGSSWKASAIPKSRTATMHPGLVGRVAPRLPTRVSTRFRGVALLRASKCRHVLATWAALTFHFNKRLFRYFTNPRFGMFEQ